MTTDSKSEQWYLSAVKIRSLNTSMHVLARAITFAVLCFGLGEYGQSLQNVPPAKFPVRFESYLRRSEVHLILRLLCPFNHRHFQVLTGGEYEHESARL
jgi:hypothetical protein